MTAIDAHHHFWHYDPREYGWIGDDMAAIRRDFLPADLAQETAAAGIDGVVSVQARQSLEETAWLLGLAAETPLIRGIVGWVPLTDADLPDRLPSLSASGHLKGVRHVLHDEADDEYMLRPAFNRGIAALTDAGLTYDILIFERHLPQTIRFVDLHPGQPFVLDHIGKPRIRDGILEPWRRNLLELARRPQVCCKISGLVTEADLHSWQPADLRPYLDTVMEAFGPERLMFGSDWPVCLPACPYPRWADLVREFIASLSANEQEAVMGDTARRFYGLS